MAIIKIAVWISQICPFVGTVTNLIECLLALSHKDYNEAKRKGLYTLGGFLLDACCCLFGSEDRKSFLFLLLIVSAIRAICVFQNLPFRSRAPDKGKNRNYSKAKFEWPKKEGNQNDKGDEKWKGKKRSVQEEKGKSEKTDKRSKKNEEETRSKRGEHVINAAVVNIYKEISLAFLEHFLPNVSLEQLLSRGCFRTHMVVYNQIQSPMPDEIIRLIQDILVVDISPENTYRNHNAEIFGKHKRSLINKVLFCMTKIYLEMNNQQAFNDMKNFIEEFITEEYFVDKEALNALEQEKRRFYKKARDSVVEMIRRLSTLRLIQAWVKELGTVIENWRKVQ